ncbi:MAG: hypothetical protein R2725_11785 [Solirubrobacterales bacterium]
MAWLRRLALLGCAAVLVTAAHDLAGNGPEEAHANLACDAAGSVAGGVGIGNPVGDACEAITDPVLGAAGDVVLDPLEDAAGSIGEGVFNQITSWATDGAVWLLGEIVGLINETTTPNLLSKGFARQYKKMASIAVVLAAMMLIFAAVEGLGRGDPGMLARVFLVNVPVAALATSAAYVIVQLLVAMTDGFCEVIAHSTAGDTRQFFKGAIEALGAAGGDAGAVAGEATGSEAGGAAAGTVAVPLFVGFIAAIIAAFAAFLVWIELLMRSAAIYAVALFMPLAIAASIWPRWTGALRRTAELVVVVVFSKFVIVAIIALAASLMANTGGEVEHVLTAGALLLLACFSPIVLFKLVPFAEGAAAAAFDRHGSSGRTFATMQMASSVQMMRRAAMSNWGATGANGAQGGGGGSGGGARGVAGAGSKGGSGKAAAGGGESGAGAGSSGGGGAAATAALAAGVSAAKGSKAAGERLGASGTAEAVSGGREAPRESGGGAAPAPRPGEARSDGSSQPGTASPGRSRSEDARTPRPSTGASPREAKGGEAGGADRKPPRPGGDQGAPPKGGGPGKAKP